MLNSTFLIAYTELAEWLEMPAITQKGWGLNSDQTKNQHNLAVLIAENPVYTGVHIVDSHSQLFLPFDFMLQQQFGANCPAYAELYPDYACTVSRTEATATPTVATTTAMPPTMTTTPTAVATTMTSRSIDLALRKYQQWSSKFLTTTNNNSNTLCATEKHTTTMPTLPVATNADSVTHLSTSSSQKSNSCSHSQSQSQSHSCSYFTSSGYYSRTMVASGAEKLTWHEHQHGWRADGEGDRELLVSASKRPKVYDCMKDFLRRKLFQQRHEPQQSENNSWKNNKTTNSALQKRH
ncbi:unnamed protein product [Ceratitis capitata]|uniref:(Mediterranean fruit fly) hypothetical protein n=1 Tax=Ceratitis capitata TaxID=7213 RepID=A0A811UZC1_CERCA|nr:unnamed protein product [Ceratitis capitata]